jgi:hypothetical protein
MKVHCFTSFSFSYLAKARVLGWSLKRFHPDWLFTACITDREPDGFTFDLAKEPFDAVVWAHDLPVPNVQAWLFGHDVVEACTAVKGPMLRLLTETDVDKVFYLDPDIAVFNSLLPMVEMLDHSSILLTPHQLAPEETREAVFDNEICSLIHGTYNLGFVAIRNQGEGLRFAHWWNDRLLEFCVDDKASGIFVDQKWCDLVPAYFDGVRIVRDPGYNVASWNLSHRKISSGTDGTLLVNGQPLRFFHYTKLGPVGDAMTRRYAKGNVEVYELWAWYKRMVDRFAERRIPAGWWHFGTFDNRVAIPKVARQLYRSRADLQQKFTNPFATGRSSYFNWLRGEGHVA